MRPFLKWAGGKRWLAKQLAGYVPSVFGNYVEPFLGSAALFFELLPAPASLSDANRELIETYCAVRDHPEEVFAGLSQLHRIHNKEVYYQQRSSSVANDVERAVRFIYLNRTCWNGLYRVNQRNEFNVPIGTKNSVIFPDENFIVISDALKHANLVCCDFELAIDSANYGDVIYVDPPFTVKHNLNGFLKYNQVMFSWDDQVRLHDCLVRARDRGCHILMSNADHQSIKDLYSDFGPLRALPRASIIAGNSRARGPTTELLVVHHG
jgi:DNA adenine methylase